MNASVKYFSRQAANIKYEAVTLKTFSDLVALAIFMYDRPAYNLILRLTKVLDFRISYQSEVKAYSVPTIKNRIFSNKNIFSQFEFQIKNTYLSDFNPNIVRAHFEYAN